MPVQVRLGGLLVYKSRDQETQDTQHLAAGRQKLTMAGYNGEMSVKTRSKVKRYVTNWLTTLNAANGNPFAPLEAQRHRLVFITLTLPAVQFHDDNELKRKALQPFMQELRRRYGVCNYVWRAETQRNGNLHFHILADQPVPHKQVKALWNSALRRLGYIEKYRQNQESWHAKGFRPRPELFKSWPLIKQKEAYKQGKSANWARPNTTDIHALKNVSNVCAYVVKYMSKSAEARKVDGRIWGCTDEIRELEGLTLNDDPNLFALLQNQVEEGEVAVLEGEGFTFYRCHSKTLLEKWFTSASDIFAGHFTAQAANLSGVAVHCNSQSLKPPNPCPATSAAT